MEHAKHMGTQRFMGHASGPRAQTHQACEHPGVQGTQAHNLADSTGTGMSYE